MQDALFFAQQVRLFAPNKVPIVAYSTRPHQVHNKSSLCLKPYWRKPGSMAQQQETRLMPKRQTVGYVVGRENKSG